MSDTTNRPRLVLEPGSPEFKAVNAAETALLFDTVRDSQRYLPRMELSRPARDHLTKKRAHLDTLASMLGVAPTQHDDITAALALPVRDEDGATK